jgi:Bacterial Ig-like domain (group 3)
MKRGSVDGPSVSRWNAAGRALRSLVAIAAVAAVGALTSLVSAGASTHFYETSTNVMPSPGGPPGTVISAVAQVVGHNPQGTVDFWLFDNGACSGTAIMKTVHAPLRSKRAVSDSFSATRSGTYAWHARYSGDSDNIPSASGCSPVTVTSAGPEEVAAIGGSAGANQAPVPATGGATALSVPSTGFELPRAAIASGVVLLTTATGLLLFADRARRRAVEA